MTHDEWIAHLELLREIEQGRKAEERRKAIMDSAFLVVLAIVAIVVSIVTKG